MRGFLLILFLFYGQTLYPDTVKFKGLLEPLKKEIIYSKIYGTLTYSTEEGSKIKKGQVLFKMDIENFETKKFNEEAELKLLKAAQKVQLIFVENQLKSRKYILATEKINFEIAELKLQELTKGALEADVKIAEETLKLSRHILKNTQLELTLVEKLFDGGYLPKSDLENLEFKINKELENTKLYEQELILVKQGPTKISVEEARIKRDIRKKSYDNKAKQVGLVKNNILKLKKNHDRDLKIKEKRLAKTVQDIKDAIVYAPLDGTVFFERFHWGSKITTGRNIWKRMGVRSIANLDEMKIRIKIPVEKIDLYKVGQKAKLVLTSNNKEYNCEVIRIHTLQEDEFADVHYTTKNTLGEANKAIFPIELKIASTDHFLKPGMSATVIFSRNK
ncbi:MAG: hypothetical protein COA79_14755 [Planctomycetota bacterium]|nr:MAG: hypothetical protein COA79_14755 [Planctomycetota bacterium]